MLYKYSVRTSQEIRYVSATKPNRLMLCREIIAVYWENHTIHTNIFCERNAEFWYVKGGGTYSNNTALKGCLIKYGDYLTYIIPLVLRSQLRPRCIREHSFKQMPIPATISQDLLT
jgi:hypothetical protein